MDDLLWLLLPVAAASGWALAKREIKHDNVKLPDFSSDYFKGLNYLLNEQTDKAIECFVRMLEVDSDTVEIHLAVGNLFRQRGEVDRAIRVHQNLITRPTLSKSQRAYALLELAQDYMRAGLFDRAETLCRELIDMEMHVGRALSLLSDIYQQEKEWEQAIAVSQRLHEKTGQSMERAIAHFHCELAEQARDRGDQAEALRCIERALATDPDCVRATIIRAEIACAAGRFKDAIRAYRHVEQQDPEYLPEVIPSMVHCYQQLGKEHELLDFLQKVYAKRGGTTVLSAVAKMIELQQGKDAARRYLIQRLHENPSLRGVSRLMDMEEDTGDHGVSDLLDLIKETVDQVLEEKPVYQCTDCGFAGKALHWRCPGCKRWGTVKPISGLEGE
jgi:lipopolysaccharide assembly protein B